MRVTRSTSNPIITGAATVLIVVLGVFLAYNANSGLPLVATYDVAIEVPDAARLVAGNEVRIGGRRGAPIAHNSARRRRQRGGFARRPLGRARTAGALAGGSSEPARRR